MPRDRALQQEKPLQWEACAPQRRVAPARRNKDPTQPKNKQQQKKEYDLKATNLFKAIIAMTKLPFSFISRKKGILVDLLGKKWEMFLNYVSNSSNYFYVNWNKSLIHQLVFFSTWPPELILCLPTIERFWVAFNAYSWHRASSKFLWWIYQLWSQKAQVQFSAPLFANWVTLGKVFKNCTSISSCDCYKV